MVLADSPASPWLRPRPRPRPHPCTGYLTLKEVFSYGALMGVVNLLLWGVVGGAWWKALGFF